MQPIDASPLAVYIPHSYVHRPNKIFRQITEGTQTLSMFQEILVCTPKHDV
jgi:hypothetical protein